MICDVCGMGTRCNCWARGKTMIRDKYSESLQEKFCDELERHDKVLARRYDHVERNRLMQAAATLHTWLSSLDSEHQEAAANLTCADLANAFATTVGGLRSFGCTDITAEVINLRHRLSDAVCVLNGMGIERHTCPGCACRTLTDGYVCWRCRYDPSA